MHAGRLVFASALKMAGMRLLHREIKQLISKPIDGINICEDEADLFSLCVIITGPGMARLQIRLLSRWLAVRKRPLFSQIYIQSRVPADGAQRQGTPPSG